MPARHPAATDFSEGVKFVDEDDARGFGKCLGEHVADSRSSDTNKHFHEVRTRQAEERHPRFTGDSFGEQSLACPRRPDQQHPTRDASAEGLVLRRRSQKLDHFSQFLDRFVDASHLIKGDPRFLPVEQLASAAAKRHGGSGPRHLAKEEDQCHQGHRHHHQRDERRPFRYRLLSMHRYSGPVQFFAEFFQ